MNGFVFHSATEFVFGRETESKTGELTLKYGGNKAMVVFGEGHVVASGLLGKVEKSLTASAITYIELGGVKPNPTDQKVYEGIRLARTHHIDFLIAVGGGSVIDTAKAIAAGVLYAGDFWDFYIGMVPVVEALPVGVVLK